MMTFHAATIEYNQPLNQRGYENWGLGTELRHLREPS